MNAIFICSVCLVRNDLTKYYYIACSLSLRIVVNVAARHSSALLLQLKTFGRWGIFCRNQVALNVNPLHIFFFGAYSKKSCCRCWDKRMGSMGLVLSATEEEEHLLWFLRECKKFLHFFSIYIWYGRCSIDYFQNF